ncbi:MAG: hypothetical protein KDA22_04065 [Phycisphaerales bacterium]|nr:hypothetical protein [Phycisphaerales bacterium]
MLESRRLFSYFIIFVLGRAAAAAPVAPVLPAETGPVSMAQADGKFDFTYEIVVITADETGQPESSGPIEGTVRARDEQEARKLALERTLSHISPWRRVLKVTFKVSQAR